jgi:PAS domain S-box-containing protein
MHFSMKYNQTQMFWRSAALFLFGCVVLALLTFVCFRLHATDAITGLLYLVVVVLISLQGRLVPALLIAITALCCLNYYFTRPLYELTLVDPLDFVALATFVTTALVVNTLVSRARKSFQEIEALRDQLRLIIDTIPGLIWSAFPDGSVDFANRRWLEYTGLSLEDARGWGWASAVHPEDAARLEEWRQDLTTGQPIESEFRLRRADGEYRSVLTRAMSLRDELGNIIKWYGTSTDIEQLKRAEENARKTHAQLAHVTRLTTLGELAASIAHEVNQPLTAITNNANACLDLVPSGTPELDEVREALSDIVNDADRASAVLARIRALAKKAPLEKRRLDLREVVSPVLVLAKHESATRRVSMRAHVPEDLPFVSGDRVQLQQVLLNLVMNGMDAMNSVEEEKRILRISGRRDLHDGEPAATIRVQDFGIGLRAEEMDRVFDAFYTTKPQGMGVGLAISRSIIEEHGGRLWAEPNQGPGATFLFSLPAAGGSLHD